MWILQRLVIVVAFSAVLLLVAWNAKEEVDVKFWFGSRYTYYQSPLPVIMVAFFLIGVFFYYVISIPREWRLRSEIRRLKRSTQARDRELSELRHIALTDDLDIEEPMPGQEAPRKEEVRRL